MDWKLREHKIKLEMFFERVKDFNFTKYLLDKKEGRIRKEIENKGNLIEHHTNQIELYRALIETAESEIVGLHKEIETLQKDAKKVIKVINMYIV